MTTLYIHHDRFIDHATPTGHPERADRLRAINKVMADPHFDALKRIEAPLADLKSALLAHPQSHIDHVVACAPETGFFQIDPDTVMSPATLEAAQRAIGGAVHAVDEVVAGSVDNAFVAARPPGHHAERTRAMGFCFFNTAAIAALHAMAEHGAARVAVLDFDVHHGNGTQDIFWDRPNCFYGSTHQMPLYPGTGAARERGKDDAGNIVNVPLAPGDGRAAFEAAWAGTIIPALSAFSPEFVVISAGFDAHRRDPLGNLELVEEDFAWITEALLAAARESAKGRVVSVLEGGYDLQGLSQSVAAHVASLMAA